MKGDVTLDKQRMQATVGKRPIDLTTTEFELLATLASQPGRVFTRTQLLDAIRELRRYADALGVTCFIFRVQWPGMAQATVLRTITLLAERVMPALRQ